MTKLQSRIIGAENASDNTSQEVDVVQMILEDRKNKQPKVSAAIGITTIDAEAFFLDNNRLGAMTIETFKELIDELSSSQLQELQLFFQRLNEGSNINFKPLSYGNGKFKSFYASIVYKKGREDFRLPAMNSFYVFLTFYMSGKLICNFTMKELYDIVKA
jgi:hypothetical protein